MNRDPSPIPRTLLTAAAIAACSVPTACWREDRMLERESGRAPAKTLTTHASIARELTERDGMAIADVAARALPAVVSVASTRVPDVEAGQPEVPFDNPFFKRFFGPSGPSPFLAPPSEAPLQHGLGSGVIVGKDVILTNAHVVEGAKEIVVTAGNKRVLKAKVVGSDPKSDLAVLRVTSDTSGLTPLEFADSSAMRLGEVVLAIGYPFGLSGTVTMGIISAKGRANLGIADYEDFLQTDAAINPGNSGGALVDLRGRLVGIPTAILSRSGGYMGVGFAIPSNMAKPIMTSLLEQGHVTRGFLGVTIQALDDDLARALGLSATDGVLIAEVSPGGPAAKAGLRRGDVVVSVDGKKVDSTGEFRNLIAAAGAKKTTELELLRDGKREKVRAELAATPEEQREARKTDATSARPGPAGLRLAPLDATARRRLDVPPSVGDGALVAAVDPASPAAEAGLRPGDVILEIGTQPVKSAQRFADVWEKTQGPIALLVFRDGHSFYVVLKR